MKYSLAVMALIGAAQAQEGMDACMPYLQEQAIKILAPHVRDLVKKEGMGAPDIFGLTKKTCAAEIISTGGMSLMTPLTAAKDLAGCKAAIDTMVKDVMTCLTPDATAAVPSRGGCQIGTAEGAVRRACAVETECCGHVRAADAAADSANQFEVCYDSTKTEFDGSIGYPAVLDSLVKGDMAALGAFDQTLLMKPEFWTAHFLWYVMDDVIEIVDAAITGTMPNEQTAIAAVSKVVAAKEKKDVFGCIAGANVVAASAAALAAAAYFM